MDEKLSQFIDHSRDKGLDHATIRHVLLSVGWREKDIAEVFCARDLELAAKGWSTTCRVIARDGDFPDHDTTSDHRAVEVME